MFAFAFGVGGPGFTTFLGMSILSCGPGKAFYGFGFLFMYMVVLGLFHGLCVLPVILSIVNPTSISDIIKPTPEQKEPEPEPEPEPESLTPTQGATETVATAKP